MVTGDSEANAIDLTVSPGSIAVDEHDGFAPTLYPSAAVTSISIDAREGSDRVTLDSAIASLATLIGGAGNDTMQGGGGADELAGGGGDDVLDGGSGSDHLDGGAGNDTVSYALRTLPVTASLGPDYDGITFFSEGGGGENGEQDTYRDVDTLLGGSGNDVFHFALGAGVPLWGDAPHPISFLIDGRTGDDQISSLGYDRYDNITLHGGDGNDSFSFDGDYGFYPKAFGDAGDDVFHEPIFQTLVDGGLGYDAEVGLAPEAGIITMQPGIEKLEVLAIDWGSGREVRGNELDNDITVTVNTPLLVLGGAGDDRISLVNGLHTIGVTVNGEEGSDTLMGGTAEELLLGGGGDDTINGGSGQDTIDGAGGNDLLLGSLYESDGLLLRGGPGNDTLWGGLGDDTLDGGGGADEMSGSWGNDTVDYSTRSADLTIGLGILADDGEKGERDNVDTSVDVILGGRGNDLIKGHGGANVLVGGGGNDTLRGNHGNDTLMGNAGSDLLLGEAGNDSLLGADGNDTLDGGSGADVMKGDGGTDTADYSSRSRNLTIGIGTIADDGETGEHDNVYLDVERITGGSGNDRVNGSAGANVLSGGKGDDTLMGNGANDTVFGNEGNDSILGGDGSDILDGGGGIDQFFGGDGSDAIYARDGNEEILNGGSGSDKAQRDTIDVINSVEENIS